LLYEFVIHYLYAKNWEDERINDIFDGLNIDIFESIFGFSINPVWLWIALMIIVLIAGMVKGTDSRQRNPSRKQLQYIYRPTKP
jgi:F0F1-type ATP synthase membrane subunit a